MSGQVKWFGSKNINAPKLSNNWGCMIDVLDACLVTGFGSQLVSSLVINDGVAIATFGSNHNIEQFQWIEISGSNIAELNAQFKVLGVTSNTLEFLVDLSDQTVSGTISCKLASAGWTKAFAGLHKAVYQAKDLIANPYFLRVDNSLDPVYTTTYAKFAKVGILESCTSIDDISGNQAPFDSTNTAKNWIGTGSGASAINGWAKWYHATSINTAGSSWTESSLATSGDRDWVLVATKDSFFILPSVVPNTSTDSNRHCSTAYGFGVFEGQDIPFLSAQIQYASANQSRGFPGENTTFCASSFNGLILLKDANGAYQPDTFTRINFTLNNSDGFTGYSNVFSRKTGENIYHCPFLCIDKNNYLIGEPPLLRCVMNSTPSTDPAYALFTEDNRAYLKRRFMVMRDEIISAFFCDNYLVTHISNDAKIFHFNSY